MSDESLKFYAAENTIPLSLYVIPEKHRNRTSGRSRQKKIAVCLLPTVRLLLS